jgi:hypothetical protein
VRPHGWCSWCGHTSCTRRTRRTRLTSRTHEKNEPNTYENRKKRAHSRTALGQWICTGASRFFGQVVGLGANKRCGRTRHTRRTRRTSRTHEKNEPNTYENRKKRAHSRTMDLHWCFPIFLAGGWAVRLNYIVTKLNTLQPDGHLADLARGSHARGRTPLHCLLLAVGFSKLFSSNRPTKSALRGPHQAAALSSGRS